MAETQVTITLGRTGQVVKRAGASELSDPVPVSVSVVGSKRSVRDRLGSSVDALHLDNKRFRGDNGRWNLKGSSSMDDFHLSKDDLRFKIMKRTQSNGHEKSVDLRDMLSRRARPSTTNPVIHEPRDGRERVADITRDDRRRIPDPRHMPEPRNERQGMPMPDPRNERLHMHMSGPRDERQHVPQPQPRDDRHRMAESRDDRQRMAEPLERVPKPNDDRQRIPEPTMTRHFTSMRSPSQSQMDIIRNSYSPWTLDHIRRKSPEALLHTSSSRPPTRTEEPLRRPIISGAYEDSRSMAYATRDAAVPITTTTPFLTKPSLSIKPLPAPSLPPAANMQQRPQFPVEAHLTVEGFLRTLGLEKYLISFKVEEVDMAALSQMGDHDLKELGIPMGPRKKILLALLARTRRQAR